MKYVDEYRHGPTCRRLIDQILSQATRRWTIMEVCGGQTHGLLRHGIDEALAGKVQLLHGPGCPVWVTPREAIDLAVELATREAVTIASFGDMLRVPGSRESLSSIRGRGGKVRIVYSPLDAVQLAQKQPEQQIVFFAVGFETTAPATAMAVKQANALKLENFSLLVAHVRVLPAMELLVSGADHGIDGFLAAGHVCTVTGFHEYDDLVERFGLPVVVTGFEPVDLLAGIEQCVRHLEAGEACVTNCYPRSAAAGGNRRAVELIDEIYEPSDRAWRGMGEVPRGGLRLREAWRKFDARQRFPSHSLPTIESADCRSGEVLAGRIKPTECEQFGVRCTPEHPLGAPMVATEGACAAYYQHRARQAQLEATP